MVDVMDNEEKLLDQLKSSYRKYKTHIYYDNYSSIQRLNLSRFELNNFYDEDETFENKFEEFFINLKDEICSENFENYIDNMIQNMEVLSFPKSLKNNNQDFISNYRKPSSNISKIHYFLDLPVEGHILGVLWILRTGYLIDEELDTHCYGNRLNETLINRLNEEKFKDFSPFLFNPYYKNYQSWRDNGLNSVNKLLDENQNVIMLSLDFKDYYYRSLIDFNVLFDDISRLKKNSGNVLNDFDKDIDKKLNIFIKKVFEAFSSKFNRLMLSEKNSGKFEITEEMYKELFMIPLGFLPSLIIANWNLNGFDKSILQKLHPFYYGRYVDDVLIVFGFHENSHANSNLNFEELDSKDFLKKYFTLDEEDPSNAILKCFDEEKENDCKNEENHIFKVCETYVSNNINLKNDYRNLEIQKNKIKIYKFYSNCPDSIIKNFRKEIFKNSSEFRMMHDSESILDDLEKNIYKIDYEDSINKLNDIKEVRISKYEISKILSRLNLSSKNITDNLDEKIINNVINAFNGHILDYMILWEKIFNLLLINNKFDELYILIQNIYNLINEITLSDENLNFFIKGNSVEKIDNSIEILSLKKSLIKFLYSSVIRSLSLKSVKFKDFKALFDFLNEEFEELSNEKLFETFLQDISCYIFSLMYNNSLMKYPLNDNIEISSKLIHQGFDLSYDLIHTNNQGSEYFKGVYPRFIKLNEFIFHEINNELFRKDSQKTNDEEEDVIGEKYICKSLKRYKEKNFGEEEITKEYFLDISNLQCNCGYEKEDCPIKNGKYEFDIVKIGKKLNNIKVGILNTELNENFLYKRLKNEPCLNQERLDNIKNLINEAINKNVQLLVMPEMYIPFEWVEDIVKVSKDHQIAMIFGVEPIINDNHVGNYIMASLPFLINDKYQESLLVYRLKNHYSPYELKIYKENDKIPIDNESNGEKKLKYHLFIWNDIYIVPYYCFEIANINDRGIFKSCCDIITVSEFNKDTRYFNNIAESLSRDLFCYCIKSNTSQFGGSVILQPSPSETKYLINLKGGDDDYIVTCDLDIKKLREDAIKNDEYTDKTYFKPKPPGFNRDIVRKRIGIDK